jgi:hypothetical protein
MSLIMEVSARVLSPEIVLMCEDPFTPVYNCLLGLVWLESPKVIMSCSQIELDGGCVNGKLFDAKAYSIPPINDWSVIWSE